MRYGNTKAYTNTSVAILQRWTWTSFFVSDPLRNKPKPTKATSTLCYIHTFSCVGFAVCCFFICLMSWSHDDPRLLVVWRVLERVHTCLCVFWTIPPALTWMWLIISEIHSRNRLIHWQKQAFNCFAYFKGCPPRAFLIVLDVIINCTFSREIALSPYRWRPSGDGVSTTLAGRWSAWWSAWLGFLSSLQMHLTLLYLWLESHCWVMSHLIRHLSAWIVFCISGEWVHLVEIHL